MKKTVRRNGTETLVFERGDGVRRRYLRFLEEWRERLPDPVRFSNGRMLRHPPAWYLDEAHVLARPSIGLYSLARFAEWLLYSAEKRGRGGKAHALAARLFALVRARMKAYMHRTALGAGIPGRETAVYAGACRSVLPVARAAYGEYEALVAAARSARRVKRPRPLDAIRRDMTYFAPSRRKERRDSDVVAK